MVRIFHLYFNSATVLNINFTRVMSYLYHKMLKIAAICLLKKYGKGKNERDEELYKVLQSFFKSAHQELVEVENGSRNQIKYGNPYNLYVEYQCEPNGKPM